jgi:hypothetical protein
MVQTYKSKVISPFSVKFLHSKNSMFTFNFYKKIDLEDLMCTYDL